MLKKTILSSLIIIITLSYSCNMLMVAVRNVPVFFIPPEKVYNKIKEPIKPNVRLSVLWIGHSTALIQMDDKVIITDPVLTETVGEFARRVYEPGIDEENIPKCDLILLSHSHFDHLSFGSLDMLEGKSPRAALVFPDDMENHLPSYSFDMVRMKNNGGYLYGYIGESKIIKGIKITTVYAQHWGGRYGIDGYLWADNAYTGFILEYNGMTVYFAGDTGYDEAKFKLLSQKFNIDVGLIPIGPCADCDNCGTHNHVFPPDAVKIFKDLNAKHMVPIHYGTLHFALADPFEPLISLKKIIVTDSLQSKIDILKIGEQKVYLEK